MKRLLTRAGIITLAASVIVGGVALSPASAATTSTDMNGASYIVSETNKYRKSNGAVSLKRSGKMDLVAQAWADKILKERHLYHNPNHSKQLPTKWSSVAENVGYACGFGGQANNAKKVMDGWKNSAGHRKNMLTKGFNYIGVGFAYDKKSDCLYAVQNFGRYTGISSTHMNIFRDVTSNVTAIEWMYKRDITKGWNTSKGREYRPSTKMTRGTTAALLYREFGAGEKVDMNVLKKVKDVNSKSSHSKAIAWAIQNKIFTVDSKGYFKSGTTLTRGTASIVLHRVALKEKLGGDTNNSVNATAKKYKDVTTKTSGVKSIAWMTENGITTGYSDKSFRPGNSVTRSAMATFMYRVAHN